MSPSVIFENLIATEQILRLQNLHINKDNLF